QELPEGVSLDSHSLFPQSPIPNSWLLQSKRYHLIWEFLHAHDPLSGLLSCCSSSLLRVCTGSKQRFRSCPGAGHIHSFSRNRPVPEDRRRLGSGHQSPDQYALENVLSPLFLDVSGSGDVTTRNQQLAFIIATEDKSLHLQQKIITVRIIANT